MVGSDECAIDKPQTKEIIKVLLEHNADIKTFIKNLRDELLTTSISREQLQYLGSLLFEYGNLENKKGTLEHILPTDQLTSEIVLNLLIPNTRKVKGMIEGSNDPSEFLNKMKTFLEGELKNSQEFIQFCKEIGIKIKKAK